MSDYVKSFHYSDNKYKLYQVKYWLNYFFLHYPNPNKTVYNLKSNNSVIISSSEAYSYIENQYIVKEWFKNPNHNYENIEWFMSLS